MNGTQRRSLNLHLAKLTVALDAVREYGDMLGDPKLDSTAIVAACSLLEELGVATKLAQKAHSIVYKAWGQSTATRSS